jgi:hypothetical protein
MHSDIAQQVSGSRAPGDVQVLTVDAPKLPGGRVHEW